MHVTNKEHWKIADLPWGRFRCRVRLNAELLKIVKAAALVEYNAKDYATYLANVFPDDPGFQQEARDWSVEETQHGAGLGAWAQKADPSFDFEAAFAPLYGRI